MNTVVDSSPFSSNFIRRPTFAIATAFGFNGTKMARSTKLDVTWKGRAMSGYKVGGGGPLPVRHSIPLGPLARQWWVASLLPTHPILIMHRPKGKISESTYPIQCNFITTRAAQDLQRFTSSTHSMMHFHIRREQSLLCSWLRNGWIIRWTRIDEPDRVLCATNATNHSLQPEMNRLFDHSGKVGFYDSLMHGMLYTFLF